MGNIDIAYLTGKLRDLYEWFKANPAAIIALAGALIAAMNFAFSHSTKIRDGCKKGFVTLKLKSGLTLNRYLYHFFTLHHKTRNIYLEREEFFDVTSAYVPLRVLDSEQAAQDRPAIEALRDKTLPRLMILGNPGTGKTTLLKAFGVHLASGGRGPVSPFPLTKSSCLVPIYIELRDFAAQLKSFPTLTKYIVGEVLPRCKVRPEVAEEFFRQIILKEQCVVLLDALDEVGVADYDAVRREVIDFINDGTEELPTGKARIVMTCREQNFIMMRSDWYPGVFPRHHVLAPFSDADIALFVNNRSKELPPGKTVAAFLDEVRQAGVQTADLHRTPLTLTISLSLYCVRPQYNIPRSIAEFYEEIVKELLQRHDFRNRPHLPKRNEFPADQKYDFLREFALRSALAKPFDDFSYADLKAQFDDFSKSVPGLAGKAADAFIRELTDNAGLLKTIVSARREVSYLFAHRSFHEYLAAVQLGRRGEDGLTILQERLLDDSWRQAILFYGALGHDHHDRFLVMLTERNPLLAGHVVPVANRISIEQARKIVRIIDQSTTRVNALAAASALSAILRSESENIRAEAMQSLNRILREVLTEEEVVGLWHLSEETVLDFLNDLAQVGTPEIARICIKLAQLNRDPRTIEPLWRLLDAFSGDRDVATRQRLIENLLEMVQDPASLDALEQQPVLELPYVSDAIRSQVFPFREMQASRHNLATLLAMVDSLNIQLSEPITNLNGFLQAFKFRNNPGEWRRLASDVARRPLYFRPVFIGWCTVIPSLSLCLADLLWNVVYRKIPFFIHYHVVSPLLFVSGFVILGLFNRVIHESVYPVGDANLIEKYTESKYMESVGMMEFIYDSIWPSVIPTLYIFVVYAYYPGWFGVQVVMSLLLSAIFYWLFTSNWFNSDNHVLISRRGSLVALIDDRASNYWVRGKA